LIPKFYKCPPPKERPDSRMAMPSPVVTRSCNQLVFYALDIRPSVAGPPPINMISALLYLAF